MKYLMKIMIIIYISILPLEIIGQGSVTNITFYSNALSMNRNVQIYLPEGYNPQDSIRYPVVYFLHGANSNHTSYSGSITILNNLIGSSTISPIILVKPDGSVGPWAGSMYTNSDLYGNFEDYIVYDLVEFIDSTYNTYPTRNSRVIMGRSMGGYGSMKLALKYPDIYCGVAAHSSPLDFNQLNLWISPILAENGGDPVQVYNPDAGPFSNLFYTAAGAFSPNLNNTPYQVDIPLDSMGVFIDSIYNRWLEHDPARLATNINPDSDLAIYFDCGMQDELLFYPFNTSFADSLDTLGLNYIFQSYTGGHSTHLANRFPISLSFLDSVLSITTNIKNEYNSSNKSFWLSQNYPNPFNPNTTIEFTLQKKENVKIEIFNMLGQKVETLLNKQMSSGSQAVEFNAQNLPSGVYLYKIEAGRFQEVKKMVLLR